ncbi:MAG: amidohydrolase family protein [Burkholderiales bacterium]|nr:amidohydrolase family protein [Burkholderiales bacterium]
MNPSNRIYDVRFRPPFGGFLKCVMYKNRARTEGILRARRMTPFPALESQKLEDSIKECREANVTHALVSARVPNPMFEGALNDDVLELTRLHPQLFRAAIAVDPLGGESSITELRELAQNKMVVAVALEPGLLSTPAYIDDPRINPLFEECQSLGLPVIGMFGPISGPDIGFADPLPLDRVASRFPKLSLVAAHGGWPYVTQMLAVAYRRPNVYLSPDIFMLNTPGSMDYVEAVNLYLEDQFLFATAYPFNGLKECAEKFSALPFRKEILPKLFFDNAERLFGRRGALPEPASSPGYLPA